MRRRSRTLLGWLVFLLVVGLVLGAIWLLGGFRKAPPRLGEKVPVGVDIDTQRWRVAVLGGEITRKSSLGGSSDVPLLRVTLRVTNLTPSSELALPRFIIVARDPRSYGLATDATCRRADSGGFDPLLSAVATCDFALTGTGERPIVADATKTDDRVLQVVVMEQEESTRPDSFGQVEGHSPAGYVEITVKGVA